MSEQLVDVLSKQTADGGHVVGHCTLVMGDGSTKVEIVGGRAKVPLSVARMIKHPGLEVPALALLGDEPHSAPEAAPEMSVEADSTGKVASPEEIEAAKEYLESEGLEVPEVAVRPEFEATTEDGAQRCQAAKADGSQCSNPAKNGLACHLSKHQEQLASK